MLRSDILEVLKVHAARSNFPPEGLVEGSSDLVTYDAVFLVSFEIDSEAVVLCVLHSEESRDQFSPLLKLHLR